MRRCTKNLMKIVFVLTLNFSPLFSEEKKSGPMFIKFLSKWSLDYMAGQGSAIGLYRNSVNDGSYTFISTTFYDTLSNEEKLTSYYINSRKSNVQTKNNYYSIRFYTNGFLWGLMANQKILRVTQARLPYSVLMPMTIVGMQEQLKALEQGLPYPSDKSINYLYLAREDKIVPLWDFYIQVGYIYEKYYIKPYIILAYPLDFFVYGKGFHIMTGLQAQIYKSVNINFEGYHMRYQVPDYKNAEFVEASKIPNLYDSGFRVGISLVFDPD